ncbi:MAG TPA: hypothetical protein VHF24_01365 [Acidimicrobiales bacterium]|jgi:hypothetical protein|nr:hypothetical protein [Acidimicrobiales bacterium]HEX2272656.1 hypothetical protein [Acidimicrobiales bacterium]
MALWWIGNILLIFVIPPVVLLLLNKVLRPILEIDRYVADVLEHGVLLTGTLDAVPNLVRTCELTGQCRLNVTRYGLALARLLPD